MEKLTFVDFFEFARVAELAQQLRVGLLAVAVSLPAVAVRLAIRPLEERLLLIGPVAIHVRPWVELVLRKSA